MLTDEEKRELETLEKMESLLREQEEALQNHIEGVKNLRASVEADLNEAVSQAEKELDTLEISTQQAIEADARQQIAA